MCIKIKHCHNHPIQAADALKNRNPTPEIQKKFLKLFSNGHSAASALEIHKYEMQIKHQDNYYKICADRGIVPDKKWCNNFYRKIFLVEYGNSKIPVENLENFLQRVNYDQINIKLVVTNEDKIIVAICTPLMRRILKHIQQSGELCFVDSSGNIYCFFNYKGDFTNYGVNQNTHNRFYSHNTSILQMSQFPE